MRKIILSIILLLSASASWAALVVQSSPSSIMYSTTTSLPITVSWGIIENSGGGLPITTFSSNSGVFTTASGIAPGVVLGSSINTSVSISCDDVAGCNTTPEIPFSIPADVLTDAQTLGASTIFYRRTFADATTSLAGSLQINLIFPAPPPAPPPTPPTAPPPPTPTVNNPQSVLSITRQSLRFSDNSTRKLIETKTKISAVAELKYTGSGLLDAFWEYVSPLSSTGRLVYTPLYTVRRYLGIGGRVILQSPPLPTSATGQYILRLRILKTPTNPNGVEFTDNLPGGLPILRYTVIESDDKNKVSLPPIQTNTPNDNTVLQTDTIFNWQAVDGANAYQLELYIVDSIPTTDPIQNALRIDASVLKNKKPEAGLLIPAKETSLSLSTLARGMLKQQQSYYWRIIAIGNNGKILTTSSIKTIRTQ